MIIPGVQNPHCSAWQSVKACCTGCSFPSFAMPSIVTMSALFACAASIVHDFTARPFMWIVQQPHCVVSHPMCVPVSPRSSRMTLTSSVRSSTWRECFTPLTVSLILAIVVPVCAWVRMILEFRHRATRHDIDEIRAVFARSVDVFVHVFRRHLGLEQRIGRETLLQQALRFAPAEDTRRGAGDP